MSGAKNERTNPRDCRAESCFAQLRRASCKPSSNSIVFFLARQGAAHANRDFWQSCKKQRAKAQGLCGHCQNSWGGLHAGFIPWGFTHWSPFIGPNPVDSIHWAHHIGLNPSGPIHWTRSIGLNPLGTSHWTQSNGLSPLEPVHGDQPIGLNPWRTIL